MYRALLACLASAAAGLVISAAYWGQVPDPMPSHWNVHGQVDGWLPRSVGLMLMPGLALFLGLLLTALQRPRPGQPVSDVNNRAAQAVCGWMAVFFLVLHIMTVRAALTPGHPLSGRLVVFMVGALFVALGRMLPGLERNKWIGIRVPWTMNSDAVWRGTHRFAGPCFAWSGVAAMLGCLLPPVAMFVVLMVAILGGCLLAPLVVAYLLHRAEQESRR